MTETLKTLKNDQTPIKLPKYPLNTWKPTINIPLF